MNTKVILDSLLNETLPFESAASESLSVVVPIMELGITVGIWITS